MGRVAIYQQAKGLNNLAGKHYLTWDQEERFMENKYNMAEEKATSTLGEEVNSINLLGCDRAKALAWETADNQTVRYKQPDLADGYHDSRRHSVSRIIVTIQAPFPKDRKM